MNINILQHFIPIYNNPSDLVLLIGTAASGKSYHCALWVLHTLLSYPNATILLVRKQFNTIRNSILEECKSVAYDCNLQKYYNFQISPLQITCKANNSKAIAYGCSDADQIKSVAEATHVFIEEADQLDSDDFDTITSRVRSLKATQNQILLSFNPPNLGHWIVERYFNKGNFLPELNKPYYKIIDNIKITYLRSSFIDNPYISETSMRIYENYKINNPSLYQKLVLGNFGSAQAGNIFLLDGLISQQIPQGLKGCIYVDSAYGKSGKSDRAVVIKACSDRSNIYIEDVVIIPIFNSTQILDVVASMTDFNHRYIGFDGHFGQAAIWQDLAFSYAKQKNIKLDIIFKKYIIDNYLTTAQYLWDSGKFIFPTNFEKSNVGRDFLSELAIFKGKSNTLKGQHDDCPDALISSMIFLEELGFFIPRKVFQKSA